MEQVLIKNADFLVTLQIYWIRISGCKAPKSAFWQASRWCWFTWSICLHLSSHPIVSIIFLVCRPIGILVCNYEFFRTLFKSHPLQKAFSDSPRKMFFIFFTFMLLIVKTPLIRPICYVSGPGTTLKKA